MERKGQDMDREAAALEGALNRTIYRGEIYWVEPDPSKGSVPGFPHPHLVVQDDLFNHSRIGTVVVCALSSNLRRATEPGNVLLEPGEAGLEKQSVVIASQISTLYKSRLGERIGRLSDERVGQVLAGLRFLQTGFFRGR
jgi:mRNA interferase MazF